jgi:DNA-binding response OmpR family regulator
MSTGAPPAVSVLLVEPTDRQARSTGTVLGSQGYDVVRAVDGRAALEAVDPTTELVVLEVALPDVDGFEVCARLRQRTDAPVIVVSRRTEVEDRVRGLAAGADDYLPKPYDARELLARIAAVRRRSSVGGAPLPPGCPTEVEVGEVTIDLRAHELRVDDEPVALTPKEYALVALLARHRGSPVPRERILREVWQTPWRGLGRSLEVHVAQVRRKVGDPDLIETVRGIGYRLVA